MCGFSIKSNYQTSQSVQFRVLSDNQCEQILNAALEILERTGAEVYSEEALVLLKKSGCYVNGTRVKIPSFLIKKALNTVPSRVVLCDRNGNRKLFLEGYNSYFGPGPTNPYFIDLITGERRKAVKQDVVNTARVCDALPNIDFAMSLAMVSDCSPELADLHEVHAMLQNTLKPIVCWAFDVPGYQDIIDMCCAVSGGLEELQKNPFIVFFSMPTSPLVHSRESVDKMLFAVERGLPVIYNAGVALGGTAPVTIAGALASGTADSLVGLLLSQLKREGTPFITSAGMNVMDMSTMQTSYGCPELSLGLAASTDLFHYLGVPSWSNAGVTDSKVLDEQAALESAIQCYSAALSGANLIHDVGFLELGMSGSLEQLVMGDEIISMVRRITAGVEVNEETLAVNVVDEVGPGGHFLGTEHTFKHFKKETWFPTLLDRQVYSNWENSGKKTMGQRLTEKAKQILQEHHPEPLSHVVEKQLNKIIDRAKYRVGQKLSGA